MIALSKRLDSTTKPKPILKWLMDRLKAPDASLMNDFEFPADFCDQQRPRSADDRPLRRTTAEVSARCYRRPIPPGRIRSAVYTLCRPPVYRTVHYTGHALTIALTSIRPAITGGPWACYRRVTAPNARRHCNGIRWWTEKGSLFNPYGHEKPLLILIEAAMTSPNPTPHLQSESRAFCAYIQRRDVR